MHHIMRNYGVLLFVLLTVGLSWVVFLLPLPPDVRPMLTMMLAGLFPLPIAIVLTGIDEGSAGIKRLLKLMFD